jgi:hypothetical protein
MNAFSRRAAIIVVFLALVLGGYFLGVRRLNSSTPPAEFTEARLRGAAISQDIVNLSNEIAKDLETVNRLDNEGQSREALSAVVPVLEKTNNLKKRAAELSGELEKMTAALFKIKSQDAQRAAMESITNRMALISRLLSYSDYMTRLAEVLRLRFINARTDQSVAQIVAQINAEITAINSFNRAAGQAMERFDAILEAR